MARKLPRFAVPQRVRDKFDSATLWYRRLRTDADPRYSVGNLVRLQERYDALEAGERAAAGEMMARIVSHLVMPNGTVMVSRRARHEAAIDAVLGTFGPGLPRGLRVLELGCSLGVDGVEIYRKLKASTDLSRYRMTDLHLGLLFDPENQLAYTEAGELVQAFAGGRAVSIHVSNYFTWARPLMQLANARRVGKARRLARSSAAAPKVEVPLVHSEVLDLVRAGEVELVRQDVLLPIPDCHDLVLAFNLLVPYYFSADELRTALANVRACLSEGGLLVAGEESSDFAVFEKAGGDLVLRRRWGRGSACEALLGGRAPEGAGTR